MKKLIIKYSIIAAIIIAAIVGVSIGVHQYKKVKSEWSIAVANNKAWEDRFLKLSSSQREFQLTIDQLNNSQDSVIRKLKDTQAKLNIKNRDLEKLEYIYSTFERVDTVRFVDTVFVESLCIDTTIGDKWINTQLHLHYPSIVEMHSNVVSEKSVIVSSQKETINPPSKCFFIRWFQKKHRVVKVDVEESNPYIKSEENVFIRIID